MKIIFFKYFFLPVLCITSAYSYVFLNNRSLVLTENMAAKETKVVIHNPKNNSTQIVIIAPPKDSVHEKKQKNVAKDKNILPDVEFLKFIIDKGKEGIPVLKFDGFFASFR
jgi:hypothetical protein